MLPLAVTLLDGFKALKEQLQLLFHNNKKKGQGIMWQIIFPQ